MAFLVFGKKKIIAELNEKYEAEYKKITSCTPKEMKYPLIPDDGEYAAVKNLRKRILREAIDKGVGKEFTWLI